MSEQRVLFEDCGSFRPNWLKSSQSRMVIRFSFSLEIPDGATDVSVETIRESIFEILTKWSGVCYRRILRQRKERKNQRGH
jgi:hypothetical protein